MAEPVKLYRGPLITAAFLLLVGLVAFLSGFYLADKFKEMNYYALVALGILLTVSAVVTFIVYGSLERKFQSVISGQTLLNYTVGQEVYESISGTSSEDIRAGNRALLYIMLFFCAVLAVIGPFIVEDGALMSIIALGIALFLFLSEAAITRYRISRIKGGSHKVILSRCGAYVCGEFHSWCAPGMKLLGAERISDAAPLDGVSLIRIRYEAVTLPGPSVYSVVVPVPEEDMEGILRSLV